MSRPSPTASRPADHDFILITGCARSGTTLLASLVEKELSVAIPVDTNVVPLFQKFLFLWGDLRRDRNRQRLLAALIEFLRIWIYFAVRAKNPEKVSGMSILPILEEMQSKNRLFTSFPDLMNQVYGQYARHKKKDLRGDHGTTMPVPYLWHRGVGRLKVVHIIRDGRDVALSWCREWFGPETIIEAAARWQAHIQAFREWGRAHPGHYYELRYEDLIIQPQKAIEKVARFLGVQPQTTENEITPDGGLAKLHAGESYHPLLSGPIQSTNAYKWRREMTADEQDRFELYAGQTLADCGYERVGRFHSPTDRIGLRLKIEIDRLRPIFSIRYHRYWVRMLTPLVIRLCQTFRIPLARIVLGLHARDQTSDPL